MRSSLNVFLIILAFGLSACGGGESPTAPVSVPSGASSYTKTLSVIGIPSGKTYKTLTENVPTTGRIYDDTFFVSSGVSPVPQYAVCTDAPKSGFIGEIAGAKRNGVLNCKFKEDGAGVIYVAENNSLVKCGIEDNGMGRPMIEGTRVGGGMQIQLRKIQEGENLGTYQNQPIVGRNLTNGEPYIQFWIGSINQLLLVQDVSILRFDYSASTTSSEFKTGFYSFDGADGFHLQGNWFGANAYNVGRLRDEAIYATGISEGAEMISSGRNNPACPPTDPLNGGIVDWGQAKYSEVGKNIVPWGVLYGLAEKSKN